MLARIFGGVGGWLVSALLLVLVNLIALGGALDLGQDVALGAIGIFGGVILGGAVAGYLGSRPRRGSASNAGGALLSGGLAALLYALSVGGFLEYAGQQGNLPNIVLEHPIRMGLAVICVSALLMVVALLVGAVSHRGSRVPTAPTQPTTRLGASRAYGQPNAPYAPSSRPLYTAPPSRGRVPAMPPASRQNERYPTESRSTGDNPPGSTPAPRSRPLASGGREPYEPTAPRAPHTAYTPSRSQPQRTPRR